MSSSRMSTALKGVQTVQVPTWSDKDGQDDIRWYEATRQSNGDYKGIGQS